MLIVWTIVVPNVARCEVPVSCGEDALFAALTLRGVDCGIKDLGESVQSSDKSDVLTLTDTLQLSQLHSRC
jgi:hypothetical protein